MKRLRILPFILAFAILAAPGANARQIGGLLKRAKKKAKEQVDRRAKQEIDKQAQAAVNALWNDMSDNFSQLIVSALPKSKTSVDMENGILKREGQPDLKFEDNPSKPKDADHLHYLEVTVFDLPSGLGDLADVIGNASVEEIYLTRDRRMSKEENSGTLLDLDAGRYAYLDHEKKQFWTQTFEEMFAARMPATVADQGGAAPASESASADSPDSPEVDVEFSIRVERGKKKKIRGVKARQHIVIVETTAKSDQESEAKGKFYMVSEIWSTDDVAGSETRTEFDKRTAEMMSEALRGSDAMANLDLSVFDDPRAGDAMKQASDELSKIGGVAIQTESYFVTGPLDAELDVDKVLNPEKDADPDAVGKAFSGDEKITEQSTLFHATQFITNLSTKSFDESFVRVPGDYEEVPSPMKAVLETQEQ